MLCLLEREISYLRQSKVYKHNCWITIVTFSILTLIVGTAAFCYSQAALFTKKILGAKLLLKKSKLLVENYISKPKYYKPSYDSLKRKTTLIQHFNLVQN